MEIQNFFTKEECQYIINKHIKSFAEAKKQFNPKYMNKTSKSIVIKDDELISFVRNNIHKIKDTLNNENIDIYDTIRIVHYTSGQRLGAHRDLHYNKNFVQVTHTLFVYLNEQFEEGCTRIYDMKTTDPINIYIKNKPHYDVKPETGKALIYSIDTVHEGLEVKNGEKWAIIFKLTVNKK